ncbi:hypothetical protein WMZ97_08055 [Lentibacillus sp. N15]|uniref:hypothetical protein n=1 Tax=Lentibacillus songyuanensis TaxID=3136161 RepID=UPI0031BA2B16
MPNLPATDLGIMAEYLTAHKGVINKLELYQKMVTIMELKEIIQLQTNMMQHTTKWIRASIYSIYLLERKHQNLLRRTGHLPKWKVSVSSMY